MNTLEIMPKANASRGTHLGQSISKAPRLRHGDDAKRASELEQYINEAESGLRAILKAGFFLECLANDLPHGQLGPWVEAHCQRRSWRTVQRWKQIAADLGDAVGIKLNARLNYKLHELLALPMAELPKQFKEIREKIEAEISGLSYRQLFLKFSQSEDGEHPKRGRLKGEGGASAEQRALARMSAAEAVLMADKTFLNNLAEAVLKAFDVKYAMPELDAELRTLGAAVEQLHGFIKRTVNGRKA